MLKKLFNRKNQVSLRDVVKKQEKNGALIFTVSPMFHGAIVVNDDEDGLTVERPLVIEKGVKFINKKYFHGKGGITNHGIIVNGDKNDSLAHLTISGNSRNNGVIENYGILSVTAEGHLVQTDHGITQNNGTIDIDGVMENHGPIYNTKRICNRGKLGNYLPSGSLNAAINSKFDNRGEFYQTPVDNKSIDPADRSVFEPI